MQAYDHHPCLYQISDDNTMLQVGVHDTTIGSAKTLLHWTGFVDWECIDYELKVAYLVTSLNGTQGVHKSSE